MLRPLQSLYNSIFLNIGEEDVQADHEINLSVDEELAEQDRLLDDFARQPAATEAVRQQRWDTLCSSIRKDAEGAHASSTRNNYKS